MDAGVLSAEFDHEQLTVFKDPASGATGAVAIHSTTLGPAMGGLRLFRYESLTEALVDALRLARAMSFKSAVAGLDLGGGKAVLLDDGKWGDARKERMRAVGAAIESLDGAYITAEDVGTTPADMDTIAGVTEHVAGGSTAHGGRGDPSPATARTVFASIEIAARIRLRRDSLDGLRVGVQGVGSVGSALAGLLTAAGAEVFVADVDPRRCAEVAAEHGVTALPLDGFLLGDFDVLAPCAIGGVIGYEQAERLVAPVVAGAANNPLGDPAIANVLAAREVLYVPDFIANSGGIIHVGAEALGLSPGQAEDLLEAASARAEQILTEAMAADRVPLKVAIEHALSRIANRRQPAL